VAAAASVCVCVSRGTLCASPEAERESGPCSTPEFPEGAETPLSSVLLCALWVFSAPADGRYPPPPPTPPPALRDLPLTLRWSKGAHPCPPLWLAPHA
uniref:Uncharacterized protein n=1 Tax=Peromyscus maniculatus bairdii TaxID=230844 RepID=A0A8C8UAV8_PERMB